MFHSYKLTFSTIIFYCLFDHIFTYIWDELCWFPMRRCTKFKIVLLKHKCLVSYAPFLVSSRCGILSSGDMNYSVICPWLQRNVFWLALYPIHSVWLALYPIHPQFQKEALLSLVKHSRTDCHITPSSFLPTKTLVVT